MKTEALCGAIPTYTLIKTMTVSSVAVSQELSAFLEELAEAVTNIVFAMSAAVEDVQGIVLQAEVLLRDVTILDEILEPEEGDLLFRAIGSLLKVFES